MLNTRFDILQKEGWMSLARQHRGRLFNDRREGQKEKTLTNRGGCR